ncbi:sensor histidine kinase [Streptomyces sp. NPDC096311]|uniref:sensor histidine kinase n=1 Tax=Streptomyces sp. NPDC096311 TaxID=3366083 RepID=UPI0037F7DDB5
MSPRERHDVRASVRTFTACRTLLVDSALTALMLTPAVRSLSDVLGERPVLLPLQLALVVPLVWRRRAPLAVFGVMAAAAFVQWGFGVRPMPEDAALLVALYTVAAHRPWRPALVALSVLELGNLLTCLRWASRQPQLWSFVSLSAMTLAAAVLGANIRIRRAHLASLEDRAVRLEHERDQQARLAVAGERARIAREMHDIVTHNLSVMVALADGAVFAQRHDPGQATVAMRQISGTGRQALTDMRRFLGVLRDDETDALRHPVPDIAELESLAEQVRAAGLPVRLEVAGDATPLPAAAQLTVYRLVQEALTNTLKHTPDGTSAEVRVRCAAQEVGVTVTDDGPSAPGSQPGASFGHGIHGMRERAAAYGGELEAGPAGPHGGWRVVARLDLTGARG